MVRPSRRAIADRNPPVRFGRRGAPVESVDGGSQPEFAGGEHGHENRQRDHTGQVTPLVGFLRGTSMNVYAGAHRILA
jgi:hypothetical protein